MSIAYWNVVACDNLQWNSRKFLFQYASLRYGKKESIFPTRFNTLWKSTTIVYLVFLDVEILHVSIHYGAPAFRRAWR